MKKYLFIGIAATAMLASCTNDEIVEMAPQKAIGFSTFVDNSTRAATDPSYTMEDNAPKNWSDFSVWGYDEKGAILTNEKVSYSTNGWGYTNTAYWAANNTYNFYAIAPNSEGGKATVTKDGISEIKDFAQTSTNQIDLLYATPVEREITTITTQPDAVAFTFSHILSKVKFTFTNKMPNANTKIIVKDIKISNTALKGTASNTNNGWTWESADASNDLELDFGTTEKLTQGGNGECATEMLLIPASRKYNITFTVELYSGDATTASASYNHNVELSTEFKTGYSYNLTAEINATNAGGDDAELYPITFTVTGVNDWTSEDKELPEYAETE